MGTIRFDETVCRDLAVAARREWLETNGLGGFASSTIIGMNTRRYHGLLVAATRPPVGRVVMLSKLEETLVIEGRRYELGVNSYPGVMHPRGDQYVKEFRRDPFPVFVYGVEGVEIEKSVFMVQGANTTVIQYSLRAAAAPAACRLELRPLIAFRDYHATAHENGALDGRLEVTPEWVKLAPYHDQTPLYLAPSGAEVRQTGEWYRNFEYEVESERGLDHLEDLFQPCVLTFDLNSSVTAAVVASAGQAETRAANELRSAEIARREGIHAASPVKEPFVERLVEAADQFIVRRGEQSTVIAGYHWFSDWGRDTMIALPGLALATGRYDDARSILLAFAAHADRGMLPNRFPDAGETPEYNTVDATFWFFEAVRALAAATRDYEFVRDKLYGVLADIIAWHERGTRYGIRMDGDGLVTAGEAGVQLTWMDAKVGGWVVTPREGKAVEIQALWYNALRVMENLALRFGRGGDSDHYRAMAARARASFEPLFWNDGAGCLYDVVNGDARDASIRPNQIFAVSLFHKLLPVEKAKAVVATVERELLTPYGLRTLAHGDPHYRGRFEGGPLSRDSAYHQGTVWPWLMGPFISAYLEVHGGTREARQQAGEWIAVFDRYMQNEGVGQIPEVFDGDAPQRAGGCMAQAWSVGEILRAALQLRTAQM